MINRIETPDRVAPDGNEKSARLALFLGASMVGMFQMLHPAGITFGYGNEMAAIARNLVERGSYGNPFAPEIMTGPTALVPPLYPLFLALLFKIWGPGMVLVACGINIVVNALIATLLLQLSKVLFSDWRPGAFAGALWICSMRLMPQWDASCTIAVSLLFCLLTARTVRPGKPVALAAAAAGVLAGALSLLNPATVLVFLPWSAFLLLYRRAAPSYIVRYGVTLLAVIGLCDAPWAARNYSLWHAFALRTSFGITLYSSNNNCAESSLSKDAAHGCFQATHPVASHSEGKLMRELGEVRYDRNRAAAAWTWIRSNPARFWQLTRSRILEFWFPEPAEPSYPAYVIWLITALSLPGIILMIRQREAVTLFLLSTWLLYPLTYYIMVSMDRYRYPILWTSLLPAGYLMARLLRLVRAAATARATCDRPSFSIAMER